MYQYIISEYHQGGDIKSHFGIEKTYETIKSRFYWPNMYHHIQNYIASCHICQQCKTNSQKPKATLIPLTAPDKPMQFICIDIAYLEEDPDGYKYILLIGCVFSKFIAAIPLKDQTATVIIDAICKKWIYTHGSPKYMLSDQGSNVDGETIRTICEKLHIEKRRTSEDTTHKVTDSPSAVFEMYEKSFERHSYTSNCYNRFGKAFWIQ